jgi:hypothetical protein
MSDRLYEDALKAANAELESLQKWEREIIVRKAQIQQTINALCALVYPDALDVNALSLPDAMRLVIRSAGRGLNANDFKTKLEDIGFDTSKYENPLANIMTAMNRMVENDEMIWMQTDGKKTAGPGPELKQVPQEVPKTLPLPAQPVPGLLGGLGLIEQFLKINAERKE